MGLEIEFLKHEICVLLHRFFSSFKQERARIIKFHTVFKIRIQSLMQTTFKSFPPLQRVNAENLFQYLNRGVRKQN